MQLLTLGLSHHSAPLPVRERVVFQLGALRQALLDLRRTAAVQEAAIVSTCNRTEVYCAANDPQPVVDWLLKYHQIGVGELTPYLYTLPNQQAVQHAFRVASGLDSMVLGEPQILGQMKHAVSTAQNAGTLGLLLNRLFQRTFSVAKKVRTQTEIGRASLSMAYVAVKLAERIFPSLSEQNLLLIGAGEMVELTATHFAERNLKSITVANRTPERGAALASRFNAKTITLAQLPELLPQFDLIVTSTASSLPILGKGSLERAAKARKHQPIFIVDLAVPRDVEPEAGELDDVFLYSLDDLGHIIKDNLQIRSDAVEQAETIITAESEQFARWLEGRTIVPAIRTLQDQAEHWRSGELEKARRQLSNGVAPEQVLDGMSRAMANKFLHAPMHTLNQANDSERATLLALIERIYGLSE